MPLPKTFDAAREAEIHARWLAEGRFAAGANARPGAPAYAIVIPPPNVTGSLHIGHALNNTLQDVLIRWKRMQGFDVLWQAGSDHAGIATQMVVERRLAAEGAPGRREMGREAFAAKIWEWKAESGGTIKRQLQRLGASIDWDREAFTMSGAPGAPAGEAGNFHDAVLRVFVGLYKDGLIFRAKRLVNWDPHFETAISDLEVEQVEVKGHLWRFRYPLADGATYEHPVAFDEDGRPTAWETRDHLVVATTRPETMLGDTGVAVHPDDARYAGLVGREAVLPLVGRRLKIVADAYADPEKGTGAVKMTPAHDFNDFEVGKRTGLRAINVMTPRAAIWLEGNAEFLEGCAPSPEAMALEGLDRAEARKRIVALAEAQGWLDGVDAETHVVPHGDRSKTPIEPYLTDQWFVDAATLAAPALAAVREGRTRFVPQAWEKTYFNWLENIEPWCISRQLWWGHQIPVWYGPDGTPFCEATEAEARAAARAHYGRDEPLERDPDVLDTWFSSGLWPMGTLGWPEATPELARYYPTSVLVTGFDIIFFWVARMMMFGLHFMKDDAGAPQVPFHDVYVHALVRDEHGKKMSKSLGNVIDPLELIDEFGADATRFTLAAMAAMGRDIKLSKARVAGYRNFVTKLWNAARFAEMNDCRPVAGFEPSAVRAPLNRWIVGETARLRVAVDAALSEYRFNDAANLLYAHVWGVFCDWHLEFAKPLLLGEDDTLRDETRATTAWALDRALVLLHPLMPFVTEALWAEIAPRETPLVHADWPDLDPAALADPAADARLGRLIGLIEAIRSVRAEMNVPAGAKLDLVLVEGDAALEAGLREDLALIRRLARIEGFARAEAAPKGAVTLTLPGGAVCLPLAGVVDGAAERARLAKALGKAEKDAEALARKLSNPGFTAKAPEEVVAETRERLEALEAEAARLRAAAARAAELV